MLTFGEYQDFESIVDELDLQNVWRWVVRQNDSADLPYHNQYHAQCMVIDCYRAALFAELSQTEKKLLVISAMFHDINHSGGRTSDDLNIQEALRCLLVAVDEGVVEFADAVVCQNIIQATQYPYVEGRQSTELQRIIRDADIRPLTRDTWFEQVVIGLHDEFVHSANPPKVKDYPELFDKFYKSHAPKSQWGISTLSAFIQCVDHRVKYLSQIRDYAQQQFNTEDITLDQLIDIWRITPYVHD